VEDSVRKQAQMREEDRAFYARGLAAAAQVRAGGKTYTAAESLDRLRALSARKKAERDLAKKAQAAKTQRETLPA
jgi:hypothetical protein